MLIRIEVPSLELLVVVNHPEARYHSNQYWWKPDAFIREDTLKYLNRILCCLEDRTSEPRVLATDVTIKKASGSDRIWHRDSGATLSGSRASVRHYSQEEKAEEVLRRAEYAASCEESRGSEAEEFEGLAWESSAKADLANYQTVSLFGTERHG